VVANSVAQDYLAPQAFAFVLVVLVLGVVLRCAPFAKPPRTRVGWTAVRAANRIGEAFLRGRPARTSRTADAPLVPRVALAVGGVLSLAVIVSHQLSPYVLILSLAALVVATRRPPLWFLAGLACAEAWWVMLGYGFVSKHFRLFEFDPSASAGGPVGGGLPGVTLGEDLARVGVLLVVVLAGVGLVRRARSGRWDGAALVLVLAPGLVLLFQSYGGEGPLRAYLFALPWLALFVAAACLPADGGSAGRGSWKLAAATAAIGACTLFGVFGQEPLNYVTADDVAVSRWTLDHTATGASLTVLAPNFPERVDRGYVRHLDETRDLMRLPGFAAFVRGERTRMPDVGAFLRRDRAGSHYLILSPTQDRYLRYHDLASQADYRRVTGALLASPEFRLVYRHGDALVLALAPSREPPASPDQNRGGA
jgi:hypothetical protein